MSGKASSKPPVVADAAVQHEQVDEIVNRAKALVRQDVRRITARMGIPMNPPPPTTDPTLAGAGSLLAERRGVLRDYIVEMMRAEWAEGQDIGNEEVILKVGESVGLDRDELSAAIASEDNLAQLESNWEEAQHTGLMGVPSFAIGDELFWGSDRIDYVLEHLTGLRLAKS